MPPLPQNLSAPTNALAQRHLLTLLESHQPFMQLRASIQQITALAQDLAVLLPDYLAPHVSPGLLKDNTLTLFTNHNACAARLRHLAPSLTQTLQQRGWLVQTLRIRVRPQLATTADLKPPVKEARISATGFTELSQLSEQLGPSPLQTALAQMVARHQTTFNPRSSKCQ